MLERTPSRDRATERLAARRRRAKRRFTVALALLVLILIGGVLWGLWQPGVRISKVEVVAGDPAFGTLAKQELSGKYLGILPRNSTFFPPEGAIRADILSAHPEVAAVSIYHAGLETLAIRADERTAVGQWCGLAETPAAAPYCYVFDANGYVYAALPENNASTTASLPGYLEPLNTFTLYAPLSGSAEEPLRATLADADLLPGAFDFARQLASLGSPITSLYLHPITDASSTAPDSVEADDTLASGTRILYVLGQEEEVYTALMSAKGQMNLSNGSLDYVDLRFSGKIYLKSKE